MAPWLALFSSVWSFLRCGAFFVVASLALRGKLLMEWRMCSCGSRHVEILTIVCVACWASMELLFSRYQRTSLDHQTSHSDDINLRCMRNQPLAIHEKVDRIGSASERC
jgi:hypothetical protein